MKMKSIGMVIAGAALLVVQAQAQNLLVNGSFENIAPATSKVSSGFGAIPGWTGPAASDTGVDVLGGVKAPGAEDGVNAAYFHNQDGYAEQTAATTIQSGLSYDLRFWTMNIDTYNATWSGAGQGDITVEVYYGNDANNIVTRDYNLGLSSNGNTPGTWVLNDLALAPGDIPGAAIGQNIGIKISNTSTGVAGSWIYVDNVTLVPEPTTCALLGFGTLATVLGLRRRRA
jgi:hypothetical protein